ncbi:glycosyltransferase family 4 protein, partial [Zeaxanthinibacter enoshimensis]|uniref:glycosyltransferase family 4 protein n=1 Tax=Zeaxanthinibacter enoshimensis TaxID=392009 RepID=UPI003565F6F8
RELASIWRSDLTLIISSFEYSLLLKEAKIDPSLLLLLPFMTEITGNNNLKDFNSRKDFICIGNGKHRPNVDAVHYLFQKIWPGLKKSLPHASLRVYGAYLPEALLQLHHPAQGFYVEGWVEDAAAAMGEARVQLAPLQYGAGIKGKLLLSMQESTPSVTTRVGAEGMHNGLPWNGIIVDDPSEFINAAVKLYTDEALWSKSVDAGKTLLHEIYDQELLCQRLLDAVETNRRSMEQQRAKNLFGNILRHQSMGATMYMSKWIEAKNKNQEREQQ